MEPPNGQSRFNPQASAGASLYQNLAGTAPNMVVMPSPAVSIFSIGMPPSARMTAVGWVIGSPGLIWTWASTRLPQWLSALGSVFDGSVLQERTARMRAIFGCSQG